jgi:hypothetical protein
MKTIENITVIRRILFIFLILFASSSLFAQTDFGLPTDNSEVVSAFYTDTVSLLNLISRAYRAGEYNGNVFTGDEGSFYSNSIPFYANAYWGYANSRYPGGTIYSCSIGSYIRLNDNFSFPVFAYVAGGSTRKYAVEFDTDDYSYNGLFTGSGLVWSSSFGSIGAFAGYYLFWGDTDLQQNKQENDFIQHFKFGMIPVLNTGKIPLLKYVVSFIQNYLAFDFQESKLNLSSYEIKAYSRPFFFINSVYYGYSENYLNPALKKHTHFAGVNIPLLEIFSLDFEFGVSKLTENISGWYKYYDGMNTYRWWYFNMFAGTKFGPSITGMTLGVDDGFWTLGIIFKLTPGYYPTNIVTAYLEIPTGPGRLDIAGSFRQYHSMRTR